MNVFKEGVGLATNVVKDVVHHWNKPGGKNQVSYKEIVNLGLGGMGQQFALALTGYLGLTVGNTLIGSTIGITPMHIQYMAMISTVLNLFFTILRGKIVDNTRTKWGRFRPYIAIMGFPIIAMAALYIYLPVPTLPYTQKLVLTFLFTISIAMVLPLFTDTYNELQTVISSNSAERAKIIAINSIIYSMAPTLTGLFVPILSDMTGGYTNINTYRYVLVPVAALGVGMNLFTAFGCKERVVSSKNYVQKVNIIEGTLEIFRNKHWWIRTVSGWIGFLEGATGVIFSWIFIYGTQDYTMYGIMNTVTGTASGLAMFATPFLLKWLGNRKLLLWHNGLNIVFVIGMLFSFKIPMLFFFFNYFNAFVNALSIVYNNVMHAEVKDYQQYISGKRMDFAFGVAGMIGLPLTLSSGLVLPYFYERFGVTTNYDILFDPTIRNNFFGMLCILSIIGAALNLIPFFFYSLSVEKHRNIVKALEYRALFDDYVNDCLDDERIIETIEGINETCGHSSGINAQDEVKDYLFETATAKDGTTTKTKRPMAAKEYYNSDAFRQYSVAEKLKCLQDLTVEDMDFTADGAEISKKGNVTQLQFKVRDNYLKRYEEKYGEPSVLASSKRILIEMAYEKISQIIVYVDETVSGTSFTVETEAYNFQIVYLGPKFDVPKYNETDANTGAPVWKEA